MTLMQQQEPVDVTELLKEYEQLRDIADVEKLPPAPFPWPWVVVAVVAISLAVFFFCFKRRRRAEVEPVVIRSPKEQALDSLDVLLQSGWLDDLQVKKFTYEVNIILRRYLENEYQLQAPEQTTEEFLLSHQLGSILSSEHSARLKDFLQYCDVIKYTDASATAKELQGLWDYTKSFVEKAPPRQEVVV